MSVFFPRFAFAPARCAPVFRQAQSYDVSPASLFSLFDDATRQIAQLERHAHARRRAAQFNPRFDVKEEKEVYILEGEVPGFKDSDLSIEWKDDVLAITGKFDRRVEQKKPEEVSPAVTGAEAEAQADAEGEFEKVEKNEVENAEKAASDSGSVKSYQATVEDEEAPANASAVIAESSKAREVEQAPAAKAETSVAQPKQPAVQHLISERRTGQFLRKFAFPSNAVDHEAIKASLESGILKIVVPKAPAPESRRINIE